MHGRAWIGTGPQAQHRSAWCHAHDMYDRVKYINIHLLTILLLRVSLLLARSMLQLQDVLGCAIIDDTTYPQMHDLYHCSSG